MTRARFATLLLAAALGAAACGGPVGVEEGQRAPGFVAPLVEGGSVDLSDLRGRPLVLVFWASWCGPCVAEVPALNALHASLGEAARILAVDSREDPATAEAAVRSLGIRYPVALDRDGRIAAAYRVQVLPTLLVLDAAGRVRYRGTVLPSRIHALVVGAGG